MDSVQDKIAILSTASLFAETIKRLHEGRGLTDLLVF
jgi:phosphoribosylpyrophosphate synthetase